MVLEDQGPPSQLLLVCHPGVVVLMVDARRLKVHVLDDGGQLAQRVELAIDLNTQPCHQVHPLGDVDCVISVQSSTNEFEEIRTSGIGTNSGPNKTAKSVDGCENCEIPLGDVRPA